MPQIYLISIGDDRMLGLRANEDEAGDTLPEIEQIIMAAHPSRWQVVNVVIAGGRRSTSLRG